MSQKTKNKGFRILAIKTFKDFEIEGKPFLKVLKKDTIYPFYHCYSYPNNDFKKIIYHPEKDIKLYNLSNLPINISAVVGENGSGKSSIIDLLLLSIYNLGAYSKVLNKKKFPDSPSLKVYEALKVFSELETELLFEYNSKICSYLIKNGIVNKFKFTKSLLEHVKNDNPEEEIKDEKGYIKVLLEDFFYSIVINYSHYSFNSNEVGMWLESLFHKNDGYQTPVVINPFREEGNIDINNEKDLLLDRLTANLLEDIGDNKDSDSLRNLGNEKIVKSINFSIDLKEFYSFYFVEKVYNKSINITPTKTLIADLNFLRSTSHIQYFKKYFDINFKDFFNDEFDINSSNEVISGALSYILRKAAKIVERYQPFTNYVSVLKGEWPDSFFADLKRDQSHVTYKIKRAIYFIKYYKYWKILIRNNGINEFNLNELTDIVKQIKQIEPTLQTIQIIPPSFFKKEIYLEKKLSLDLLSSGEKQKIYSISSIAYHLINLNSVNDKVYTKYRFVNIVLDEIELYYHPDWQRKFIKELLNYLSKINPVYLEKIEGLNLLFLTHSPFILSDIPSNNVLRLVKGEMDKVNVEETFGANIHSLLRESFFMKGGLIGNFAKEKIHQLIQDLKKEKLGDDMLNERERIYSSKIIDMIGEPLLKDRLIELYRSKYESNESLIKERDRINALLEKRGL